MNVPYHTFYRWKFSPTDIRPYNNVAPLPCILHHRLRRNARILRKDDHARVDRLDRPLEKRGGDERDALSSLGLGGIVRRFWSRCQLLPFFFLFVSPRALVLAPGSPLSNVILVRVSRSEPKLIKRGRSAARGQASLLSLLSLYMSLSSVHVHTRFSSIKILNSANPPLTIPLRDPEQ